MKVFLPLFIIIFSVACSSNSTSEKQSKEAEQSFKIYSKVVKDTYNISVHLPLEYNDSTTKKYPVVFITDANFYYPMLAATLQQYEMGGLLPPMILVGIGYKSLEIMDSLRQRDFLYPEALPSDELTTSGGGENFNNFITSELIPHIDSLYRTNTTEHSLLGHSFGGYFVSFAAQKQAEEKRKDFKNFIAASPSLWYHDNYLKQLPAQLNNYNDSISFFLTVGSKENEKWFINPIDTVVNKMTALHKPNIIFESVVYNTLDHMDVGMISFLKGLQKFYVHE